ncbi:cyanobacterial porin [Oscillatoria nigro-viridis PCC 7112]|uniref:Cyanobacterial porin n=1 Tax=Phormidium nigroviride PCC 7112 TaxID=179408 RepID=K9VEZ1_9CYAN|nr:iron uptake porin [Oscillatoria nigro-viridis]AFZ06064.1 cyanobacterial porin [Oscillatoria nigro-viridis PCC 7112]
MNRTFWNLLLVSPAILGLSSVMSATAIAAEAPATAEANQLATAQSSESKISEIVKEIVAEPVAAAPAAPEKLALNSSVEAAQTPVANSADAEKLAKIEPETSAGSLQTTAIDMESAAPIAPASTAAATEPLAEAGTAAPSPQASDLAVQSSQTEVAGKIEVPAVASTPATTSATAPATTPATKVEIAQTAPAGMGGPIVPVAPQAQPAQQSGTMSQVTSVSQLSDVRPTDWAFQALQSLVERYSCIVGYPDGTYRGNRALTRYEFAAGVNACLDNITKLIGSTGNLVTRDDLAILQRLQEEFAAELATLRGRVDGLEARTAELEANQFSTTTKLAGEVIFAASDTFGDAVGTRDDKTVTNFGYRVRLSLLTSFTGRDLLKTRLQAGNIARYDRATATGTNMARLSYEGGESSNFILEELYYSFPTGNATFIVGPLGLDLDEIANTASPFKSTGTTSISRFGSRSNPAVFRGPQGAGASMTYNFGNFQATAGYLAGESDAPNPANGRGVADGSFSALGQIGFFSKPFDLGLTYTRKYNRAGDVNILNSTGSSLANQPFGLAPTASDNFGVQVNFKPSSRFQIGGWYGYTKAEQLRGGNNDATIQNGAITLALADFGRQGNLLGFVFGVPPKVTESDVARNRNTSYHLEGFYRFQVNDFIAVTPGVYVILNPEHNNRNDDIWVGLLRTTFSF